MGVIIRRAENADISSIIPLLNIVSDMHGVQRSDIFIEHPHHISSEKLQKNITSDKHLVIVAEQDTKIIGVMLCSIKVFKEDIKYQDSVVLSVEDTVIVEEYRGKNVSTSLLQYAIDFAKRYGCNRIESNVWSFNQRSLYWLQKNGFMIQRYVVEYPL